MPDKTTNIFTKVNQIKIDLQSASLKKTGKNKHSGFEYYELSDLQPEITRLCAKYGVFMQVTFSQDYASLALIDVDDPEQQIVFDSPMKEINIAGCNPIQSLGGVETYQRRYLLLVAFDITEPDTFDAIAGSSANEQDKITSEQAAWLKEHCDVDAMLKHLGKPSITSLTKMEANALIEAKKRQLAKSV